MSSASARGHSPRWLRAPRHGGCWRWSRWRRHAPARPRCRRRATSWCARPRSVRANWASACRASHDLAAAHLFDPGSTMRHFGSRAKIERKSDAMAQICPHWAFGATFPSAEQLVESIREAPTGWVVDANGRRGALDYRIDRSPMRSTSAGSRSPSRAAPATTSRPTPRSSTRDRATCSSSPPMATRRREWSGDVLVGMAKNQGYALRPRGLVRDVEGLMRRHPGLRAAFRRIRRTRTAPDDRPAVALGGVGAGRGRRVPRRPDGFVVVRALRSRRSSRPSPSRGEEAKMEALVARAPRCRRAWSCARRERRALPRLNASASSTFRTPRPRSTRSSARRCRPSSSC